MKKVRFTLCEKKIDEPSYIHILRIVLINLRDCQRYDLQSDSGRPGTSILEKLMKTKTERCECRRRV